MEKVVDNVLNYFFSKEIIAKVESAKPDPCERLIQQFAYEHLPKQLQEVSQVFAAAAVQLLATVPHNQELTLALRKLWEAKNYAVGAVLFKDT